jgi:hypothetical protein
MSQFEEKVRADLARRAEQMPVTPDLADVHARLDRAEDRRDTRFNAVALVGAAAVVVAIVGFATMMMRDEPTLVRSTTTSTTAPSPSDMLRQRAAISAAFDKVFEATTPDADRLAAISDSAGLEAVAFALRTRDQGHLLDTVKVEVNGVELVPPSGADVDFVITSTKIDGRTSFAGHAVRQAGMWKVARSTFCTVIEKIDVRCPSGR